MPRFLFILLFLAVGLSRLAPAQTSAGLPPRPNPFQFVNDQAQLLSAADAKKLEAGLRRYADETGTQVVVVLVPTLGGREVGDYGRALGTAWGVGQRDKNNGVVVVVSAQERKVTIQPGSGLQDKITPALTQRVISQDFGPSFKQGNYLLGLRKGLSTLMLAANPNSDPRKDATGATTATSAAGGPGSSGPALDSDRSATAAAAATDPEPFSPSSAVAPAESSGPGMGTLLLGVLAIGAVLWFVVRMFRNKAATSSANVGPGNAPNFNPNQPNRPGGGAPNFMPNQPQGGNYGNSNTPNFMGGGGNGPGIGGMLATGAAAAAGAYLGNRMANGGSDNTSGNDLSNQQQASLGGAGSAAGLGGTAAGAGAAGDDYFANRDGGASNENPDYFADDSNAAANNGDYFSSNDSGSYEDTSSADTGGGGFDGDDNNSGSW